MSMAEIIVLVVAISVGLLVSEISYYDALKRATSDKPDSNN